MDGLQIRLSDLATILEQNLKSHRAAFEEALTGYRQTLLTYLEEQIDRVKNNRQAIKVSVNLPVPEDHTGDYERAIRLVKLASAAGQETIELSEYDAAQYVMDDWGWKQAFAGTHALYTSGGI